MRDEDKWSLVHAYRHAVTLGEAPAILCPDCSYELVMTVDTDGDPAFRCLSCPNTFRIGLDVYDQMIRNLEDVRTELQYKLK